MKKCISIKLAVLLVVVLFFSACRDPIFFTIAQEVAPIEPRIRGTPTNMVVWENHLFVASGSRLHWYRDGNWDRTDTLPYDYQRLRHLGGRVTMLAATMNHLYALILHGNDTTEVRRFNRSTGIWDLMGMASSVPRPNLMIQTIFAPNPASNNLFIGIGNTDNSDILILRGDSAEMGLLQADTGILAGAAFGGENYFLPIRATVNEVDNITNPGNTILRYDAGLGLTSMTAYGPHVVGGFAGIINIGDSVVAIDRGGDLFSVTAAGVSRRSPRVIMYGYATGALAVWEELHTNERLLLAGRQGSLSYTFGGTGFTFGYVELAIPIVAGSFHEPGDVLPPTASTVYNHPRYVSTIGRHGINHIFQVPADICRTRRLFASTQRNGLWSYRDHFNNGEWHWNAEY